MLKKIIGIRIFVSVLICLLIAKLFYLQIIEGGRLARQATSQRISQTEVSKVRGQILDKYGVPFTDRSSASYIVLFPQLFNELLPGELSEVSKILDTDMSNIKKQFESKNQPILIKADSEKEAEIKDMNLQGISTVETLNRYDDSSLARHLIGYLNKIDEQGQSGIEKAYNVELSTENKLKVGVVTDALFNTIKGYGYRLIGDTSGKTTNVKTTLDYDIQKIVESVMEDYHITGAVVVENVKNGDIAAMASKPDYDQNNIAQFLENSNSALFNRAVASYNLGSIYKIIDVAAYLEAGGDPSTIYYCPGYETIGDTEFKCSSYASGGHGNLNLIEAFSQSCNTYFIKLGTKMGTKPLIDMARRFGLSSYTGINNQKISESTGSLPDFSKNLKDGNAANVSIGQGDVMATPLQVADIVATIANGGVKNKINLIDSLVDSDMKKVKTIRENKATRILDKNIAESIKQMMEEVTKSGTGTKANLSSYGGSAGKTGSAETGQMIGEKKLTHAWFAGYFPQKTPKYAISVFIEGGDSGGKNAAPIFAEIAQKIMEKGY